MARVCVNTLASQLDFDIDDLADIRLAVNELCRSCAEGATEQSTLSLVCTWSSDEIEVQCNVDRLTEDAASTSDAPRLASLELSKRILEALVEEFEIGEAEGGARRTRMRLRRH